MLDVPVACTLCVPSNGFFCVGHKRTAISHQLLFLSLQAGYAGSGSDPQHVDRIPYLQILQVVSVCSPLPSSE